MIWVWHWYGCVYGGITFIPSLGINVTGTVVLTPWIEYSMPASSRSRAGWWCTHCTCKKGKLCSVSVQTKSQHHYSTLYCILMPVWHTLPFDCQHCAENCPLPKYDLVVLLTLFSSTGIEGSDIFSPYRISQRLFVLVADKNARLFIYIF